MQNWQNSDLVSDAREWMRTHQVIVPTTPWGKA